jgi:dolichol-phosphate mannosyltransferase
MESPALPVGRVPADRTSAAAWRSVAVVESPQSPRGDCRDGRAIVSVVLSFWNEEEVLDELLRRLRAVFDALIASGEIGGYELIFVNDASTDNSEPLLRQGALERCDVKLINMSRNFGVSPCVLAGMLHASGDAVVYMDADLQDPPEVIPELVRAWKADPQVEVVHTVRRSRAGESLVKLAITRLGYAILRAVSTIDLPLEAGDFKLLSRRAVDYVTRFGEKRPFLRGLVCWIGFKQAIVPYHRQARHSGTTKFRVLGLKVIRNFIDSAMISFSDVPLKASAALGMLFSASAGIYMFWVLFEWSRGRAIPGWSATMVAVLFLGGVQLLSIGVLGTYISSIFLEVKGRPNFIVKDTFGFERRASDYTARGPE